MRMIQFKVKSERHTPVVMPPIVLDSGCQGPIVVPHDGGQIKQLQDRIKELEQRLGTRLLNRTTRKLVPTEAGRLFYDHARGVVASLEEYEDLAVELAGPEHALR